MKNKETIIIAKSALLPNGWTNNVFITIDTDGKINNVSSTMITDKNTKTINVDLLLPAVANLHSHSFQRAMAGLTEKRGKNGNDSFWTWRELMYKFLHLLSPEDILSSFCDDPITISAPDFLSAIRSTPILKGSPGNNCANTLLLFCI